MKPPSPSALTDILIVKSAIPFILLFPVLASAADWPCHMGNNQRNGITGEQLAAAGLTQAWVWSSAAPPQPAWAGEARYDAYQMVSGNKSMRSYDLAFNLSAAGTRVFVASTAEGSCIALNAADGSVAWRKVAGSAVRVAPAFDSGRVYFGSDDGNAYCVDAATGAEVWKVNPSGNTTMVPNQWKMINIYPLRCGVLVQGGNAYFAAGMVPWQAQYLMAVNATTGAQVWKQTFNTSSGANDGHTFEGPMLSDGSTYLYQPQGRLSPIQFLTSTGARQGRLPGGGGSWALVTPDGSTVHGPGFGAQSPVVSNRSSHFKENNATSRAAIREFPAATAVIADAANAYLVIDRKVQKLPRAGGTALWTADLPGAATLILGGTTLFAGGENIVAAIDTATGSQIWSAPVTGTVHTLALANGTLYASTSAGKIHAFR